MTDTYGTLVLTSAEGGDREFVLTQPSVTLGRDETNDIVLPDRLVSRHHARIDCSEAGCMLHDLGSGNGTFVDGMRVEQTLLVPGSQIALGGTVLLFHGHGAATTPASPGAGGAPEVAIRHAPRRARRSSRGQIQDVLLQMETAESEEAPVLVVQDPARSWDVRLARRQTWTIGRDPVNEIPIEDPTVSRHHARIERRAGGVFVLVDLQSVNGTWVNGQRLVDEYVLHDGVTVAIGAARLDFTQHAVAPAATAPRLARTKVRHPVIVVPGTWGSALWRGSECLWPNVRNLLTHAEMLALPDDQPVEARGIVGEVVIVPKLLRMEQYNRIGDYMEETLGYQRGENLLEFAYDWRQDMRVAAQHLADCVERWPVTTPITIIAHSQGCLVSRYYVERLGGRRRVGRLVLLGGPNYGAPNALFNVWPPDLLDLLPATMSLGGSLGQKIRGLFATFPSMYQFLPTYACVFDQHGQPIDPYVDDSWLPVERRPLLHAAREFRQQLGTRSSVPTVCIFGYHAKTPIRLEIERGAQGRWRSLNIIREDDGDGQIPTFSAALEGAEIHPVQQDHNSLYIDPDVLMRLKLELLR